MSDTPGFMPFYNTTPEEQVAINRAAARAPLSLTSLLPGAVAQVSPRAQTESGEQYLVPPGTGLATSVYGGLGTMVPAVLNYALGRELVPNLPGAEAANQYYADVSRQAKADIPTHMLAENDEERRLHEMMFSGGGMAIPIPAAWLGKLPVVAKQAAHFALPTKEAMPIAVPGMAIASDVLTQLGEQGEREDQADKMNQMFGGGSTQTQTGSGGPATLPFPTSSNQGTKPQPGTIEELFQGVTQPSDQQGQLPTYSGQGETETTYGQWAVRGALALGGAWVAMKKGGKLLNPILEQLPGATKHVDTAKHNAAIAAKDAGGGVKPGEGYTGEVRLPGGADSPLTKLSNASIDSNRVVNAFTEATAPSKTAAAELEATTGTTNSHAAQTKIIGTQAFTGVSEASGRVHPKLAGIVQKYDNLTAAEQRDADIFLYGMDETDTRKDWWQKAKNSRTNASGTSVQSLDDTQSRHNFYNTDSEVLRAEIERIKANPKIMAYTDEVKALNLSHLDEMLARGRITQAVYNDVKRVRPNYMSSVDAEGKIVHPFGERKIERWAGFEDIPVRSIENIVQHYDAVYKEMAKNDWVRNIIKNALDWQGADSTRPIIFREKVSPKMTETVDPVSGQITPNAPVMEPTAGPKERTITVYEDGVAKTYHVYNTTLWKALEGNKSQMATVINGANWMRRMYQSGTTGVAGSILAQRPFAVTSLLRNALQIPTDRTPGTIGGPIDRVFGGKYRGIDPFFVAGSIAEAGRGAGAVMAKNLSIAMKSADHPLRKIMGDAWADGVATKLEAKYLQSRAAARHAQGFGGAGTQGATDLNAIQLGESSRHMANPLSDVAPTLWKNNGLARLPGGKGKGTLATFINLKSLLRDLHQEVADGANAYYFELNKGKLGKRRAAYEAMRVMGDPGHMGASALAQGLGRTVPYLNPMVQDIVRMARNFRDNPFAASMGQVQVLGALALAQTLTAVMGGPDHVNHLEEGLSTQQRAANAVFYHDRSDPLNHTMISLPQRWRVMYPIMLEMISTAMGAFQAHENEDVYNRLVHTIADFFSHHIQESTHSSSLHGLSDMTDVPIPPAAALLNAALGGDQLQPHLGTLITNLETGQGPLANMTRPAGAPGRVPGQTSDTTYMSDNDGRWFQQVTGAIWGAAGKAIAETYGAVYQRMMDGAGVWGALSGFGSDAGQNFRDNAPWGTMLWGNTAKLSAFNPMEENVSSALNAMSKTVSPKDHTSLGFASSGSSKPLAIMGQPTRPQDQVMLQMQGLVKNYHNSMAPLLKQIHNIKTQMAQSNSMGLPSGMKRTAGNQYATELNNVYAQVNARINQMHEVMSRMVGGKHVDVRTIDWSRDSNQFN